MDFKQINPLWKLADPLTVHQAAALVAGFDPNVVRFNAEGGVRFDDQETNLTDGGGIQSVKTALAAMVNAITGGKLTAVLRCDAQPRYTLLRNNLPIDNSRVMSKGDLKILDSDKSEYFIKPSPDWSISTVSRVDLVAWLVDAGVRAEYFFPLATEDPQYLDPKGSRYAPKLAAAVKAWQDVVDLKGKTPKQALVKWLREHAAEFGMTDDEGKPNETGIEEVAKVANWQPGGGAPKTSAE